MDYIEQKLEAGIGRLSELPTCQKAVRASNFQTLILTLI